MSIESDAVAVQLLAERCDPIERLIESIRDERVRGHMRETVTMRREYESMVARTLAGNADEAMAAAHWIARHAEDVTHRWAVLRESATKFALIDVAAIRVRR